MKQVQQISLKKYIVTGIEEHGEPVTSNNCSLEGQVYYYRNEKLTVVVTNVAGGESVKMKTRKGLYVLKKHPSQNMYTGTCGGCKVHITLKPMVGKVIYWAEKEV